MSQATRKTSVFIFTVQASWPSHQTVVLVRSGVWSQLHQEEPDEPIRNPEVDIRTPANKTSIEVIADETHVPYPLGLLHELVLVSS